MLIILALVVGIVVGGFSGLFASLGSFITKLIAMCIAGLGVFYVFGLSKGNLLIDFAGGAGWLLGFFGTVSSIGDIVGLVKKQQVTIVDMLIGKSPKPQTDQTSTEPSGPQPPNNPA